MTGRVEDAAAVLGFEAAAYRVSVNLLTAFERYGPSASDNRIAAVAW